MVSRNMRIQMMAEWESKIGKMYTPSIILPILHSHSAIIWILILRLTILILFHILLLLFLWLSILILLHLRFLIVPIFNACIDGHIPILLILSILRLLLHLHSLCIIFFIL